MNRSDGNRDGMDQVGHLSDADLDRLLAGRTQGDAREAEALALFFHEVKARYVTEPSAATRQAHLSQILAAAQLKAEWSQPAPQASTAGTQVIPTAAGASPTAGPAEPGAGSDPPPGAHGDDGGQKPRWRRRLVFGSIFGGSITAKVAIIGVVAATAATGGLAATGFLPKSLQSAVAGAAGNVGVRLPNPQATAQLKADAQVEAGKVASSVERLVQQVAAAAEQPVKLSTSTVASTQTCTQNVSLIAAQLLNSAGVAGTPALAQSLAERATALAQESVGCALPAIGASAASPSAGSRSSDGDTADKAERDRDTAVVRAISGAVQGCATPLKLAIETLVQAAIMARSSAELQALAEDARAVATAAQGCARGVGSALQAVLPNLPGVAAPKTASPAPTPTGTSGTGSGMSGLFNLMPSLPPSLPRGLPTAAPTPVPTAPKGTSPDNPAWWKQFLSQLPTQAPTQAPTQPPKAGGSQPGTPGNASPGSGSWSGLTGSWNGSGSWSPYPSTPGTPGAQQQDQDRHQPTHRH